MLQRKSIEQHKLCWFANLFSNLLILQALLFTSVTKYQKHGILFLLIQIIFQHFHENNHFFSYMLIVH